MKRNWGRRIALFFALLAALCAVLVLVLFAVILTRRGLTDFVSLSLLGAAGLFSASAAVMYLLSRPLKLERREPVAQEAGEE